MSIHVSIDAAINAMTGIDAAHNASGTASSAQASRPRAVRRGHGSRGMEAAAGGSGGAAVMACAAGSGCTAAGIAATGIGAALAVP